MGYGMKSYSDRSPKPVYGERSGSVAMRSVRSKSKGRKSAR